jgi:hypothetical protein
MNADSFMPEITSKNFLESVKGVQFFWGNGHVYIVHGQTVDVGQRNFDVETNSSTGLDFWVTREIIVVLGTEVTRKEAVNALETILRRIKSKGIEKVPEF